MRLGAQPCTLEEGSLAEKCYGTDQIVERHRHRYEFNPEYRNAFIEAGMVPSGMSPDRNLVEIMEIADHPWFLAVQFHPEFKSKPHKPQPLFLGFIEAAIQRHQSRMQLPV